MEQPSKKGGFFSVSVQAIDQIAAQGGMAEDILGYLVLARHASVKVPHAGRLTCAGGLALQKNLGIGRRKAEAALDWLSHNSAELPDGSTAHFIVEAEKARERFGPERVPAHFGRSNSLATKVRWLLSARGDPVNLANALIDGIGKGKDNPPLTRIYNDVQPDFDNGIGMQQARLDATVLLVHLYRNTALEECGGVDPRSGLYREWAVVDDDATEGWLDRPPVMELEGTNAALYEVAGKSATVFLSFAATALAYVPDPVERERRFWCAFDNLLRLDFVYEVLTVWSGNPVRADKKKAKQAELLYTLYIFDRHAREQEPYLQRDIHSMALNRGDIDPLEMGFDSLQRHQDSLIGSGRFRFVAVPKIGAYPVGVFRPRFRAKDQETGRGIEAEQQRYLTWANHLRRISGRPPLTEWARPSVQ